MHLHRDVLAIADTFGAHVVGLPARRRVHRHPAAGLHVRARRAGGVPAAGRRVRAAAGAGHPGGAGRRRRAARRHRAVHRAHRVPGDAGGRPAAPAAPGCAGRSRPASTCPRPVWQAFHDATGVRIIDGIGSTEMLHVFISAADDDIRPGATGRAVPGYRAACSTTTASRCPTAPPGRLAVHGPDRLPLPRRRPAAQLRPARLEHHRRHLRPRRRRLLLVPGPQRRHDHLRRLQHRRAPRSRRRCSGIPTSWSAPSSAVPDEERGAGRHRRTSCCAPGADGDAAQVGELQDFVKQRDRAVQVPAHRRVRRRAAAHHHRQAAALRLREPGRRSASRVRRPDGEVRGQELTCGSPSSAAGPAGSTSRRWPRQLDPPHEITVWERNAPDDTFGFGVVFSDETLGGIEHADPVDLRRDAAGVRALGRHRRPLPRHRAPPRAGTGSPR